VLIGLSVLVTVMTLTKLEVIKKLYDDLYILIVVIKLADSLLNFTVRAWVKTVDYWGVLLNMNENVYKTFNKERLNIPYPQMDVHLHKEAYYKL